MTLYQIMIEGVFVNAPELGPDVGGFHTTFYLEANNAANAAHRVRSSLTDRMVRHGISENKSGVLKAYYWVHDLWEVTEEKFLQHEQRDSGFTFFRIGRLEKFYLIMRRSFFQRYRPWLLIGTKATKGDGGN